MKDVALVLDVIAGYDANDPVTADAVGQLPGTYTQFLAAGRVEGRAHRRDPRAARSESGSRVGRLQAGERRHRPGARDLRRLGAVVSMRRTIPDLGEPLGKLYDDNVFETEAATNKYLAQHPNAPVKTLKEILLSGKVVPSRARVLMNVGRPLHG